MGGSGAKNRGKPVSKTTTTPGGWTTPGRYDEVGPIRDEQAMLVPRESKEDLIAQDQAEVDAALARFTAIRKEYDAARSAGPGSGIGRIGDRLNKAEDTLAKARKKLEQTKRRRKW